jgi:LysM repeat protein
MTSSQAGFPRRRLLPRLSRALGVPLLLALLLSAGAANVIKVRRGDTLSSLARKYHTTVAVLRELNDMPGSNSLIFAGQALRVPRQAIASRPAPVKIRTVPRLHKVVRGDTLIDIAKRYRTTPEWIAVKNKLPRSRVVVLGDRLLVGYARIRIGRAVPARPRVPEWVSQKKIKRLIRAEAKRSGVDPHLALALSWQESGFKMNVVSKAGAIGAMQVMPETGAWVGRNIVGRRLDLADPEDNVVAGVRFLKLLLGITHKTPTAVAGYYQGLASISRNGQYVDTKAYVSNVLALQRRFKRG